MKSSDNQNDEDEINNHLVEYHRAWQHYWQQKYHHYYLTQLQSFSESTKSQESLQQEGVETKNNITNVEGSESSYRSSHKLVLQTKKIRDSRHFLPIVAAVLVSVLFMLLQYNRIIISNVQAFVSPGSTVDQTIITDPTLDISVSQDPRIIIPKMNVDAPVIYGVKSLLEDDIQMALRDGVVHYPLPGANSLPGQIGNTVLLGHTSNDVFDPGKYKFVFLSIEKLQPGDKIYINYQGTRYIYSVTKKEVVEPREVNKLTVKTDKPLITLVGCVPIGTADKRLLVTAEQISPDPANAAATPEQQSEEKDDTVIPGNPPTFFEQLFNS